MDKILVIMGPTASGKSSLALKAAQKHNGEIVSADSMQLYRGLEIGTAQPTAEERASVPHHLVGIWDINVRADVFTFQNLADAAISDIRRRGKLAIVAGGTGLYLKNLLYGLDDMPGDRELRKELDQEYDYPEKEDALREKMAQLDPEALEKFRLCRRRLIRALEVKLLTGKSILELQTQCTPQLRYPNIMAIKLEVPPEELAEKIAIRTQKMLDDGWINEARRAIENGLLQTPTAHQALGYKIIAEYLDGNISSEKLCEKLCAATRQYARRQRTWFRHQHPEAVAMTVDEAEKFISGL
ncbi:MAG: tRNA (adenosine(37)-N6)-dimethylallyltransferase MiaA [Lentisphaeria bacterium]|nr:tRNA (adenosine(37)-N6)-dimethylallyltransferase MiaA [Lentisphaeria bacterium]